MKIQSTTLPEVVTVEPTVYRDDRGYFLETWSRAKYSEVGLPGEFAQDNLSYSRKGVLRGLHLQEPNPQGKLIHVLEGEIFDVAVDVRVGSPTFLQWVGVTLSAENRRQVYVPPGFAHGFAVVSEGAFVVYKCTTPYSPKSELTIRWDAPEVGITWPIADPILSIKDGEAPTLDALRDKLPRYRSEPTV